jgi:thioredoxin-like negative regulator of GroEL
VSAAREIAATTAEGPAERPQLVFVFSSRCGRSRQVDGFLAQILQRRRNHDTFELFRIDAEERPELATRLGVSDVPSLLVLSDRRIVARLATPKGRAPITELLSPWLK